MKIQSLKKYYLKNKVREIGDVFDIEDRIANVLIARKLAVQYIEEVKQEAKKEKLVYENKSLENKVDNRMLSTEKEDKPTKTKKTKTVVLEKEKEDVKKETKKPGRKKKSS